MNSGAAPLLQMRGICKSYDGARVLDNVEFTLRAGEVHVLAGENGAGKSTLMKILTGAITPDAGTITLRGEEVRLRSPRDAAVRGIAMIHQELSLVDTMSVAENLLLGRETDTWHSRRATTLRAKAIMHDVDAAIDVRTEVAELPLAARQLVEIARALHADATLLVMDEPTSALGAPDAARLLDAVRALAARGTAIVYITHRMEEIAQIGDRVTVLRDGRNVGTYDAASLTRDALIRAMVGRDVAQQYPARSFTTTEEPAVRLRAKGIGVRDEDGNALVEHVDLDMRAGEIVGIAGLQGSGASALLHALYGAFGKRRTGTIAIDGQDATIDSPRAALAHGLALVSGDRAEGVIKEMSVEENVALAALPRLSPAGFMRSRALRDDARRHGDRVKLATRSSRADAGTLSGGNQQKVLIARALAVAPRIILLDDPTRGVDVGVKQELYNLWNEWTAAGCAVLLASSDLEELLAMSDRICAMRGGRIVGSFPRGEGTADEVIAAAMGE